MTEGKHEGRGLWHVAAGGAVYLAAFITLDWLSYIEPFERFGITPWNPQSGLSLALALVGGLRFAPFLAVAPLLADGAVRGFSAPVHVVALLSIATGIAYAGAAYLLRTRVLGTRNRIASLYDVLALLFAGTASSMIVASCYGLVLGYSGLIEAAAAPGAILRYWVGDFIGIVVMTPPALLLASKEIPLPTPLGWLRLAAVAAALVVIFSIPQSVPLQLLYVLFLPIIWIALSAGFEEVCIALFITQIGLVIGLLTSAAAQAPLLSYQLVMLVLAIAGLVMGAVVTDRRQAEQRLRLLQTAQARFNRLGSLGALSASLAHEINQPLSAASTFAKLAIEATPENDPNLAAARDYAGRSAAQIQRAAGIVRRVHDLILKGRSELRPVDLEEAIREAVDLVKPEIDPSRTHLTLRFERPLPAVRADPIQIGQVIINLLHNSVEAMEGTHRTGSIAIDVTGTPGEGVTIEIRDEGPGFEAAQLANPIAAFASTKAMGLGVGLALCERIVESHGGKLVLQNWTGGALVRFTLQEASSGREIQDSR